MLVLFSFRLWAKLLLGWRDLGPQVGRLAPKAHTNSQRTLRPLYTRAHFSTELFAFPLPCTTLLPVPYQAPPVSILNANQLKNAGLPPSLPPSLPSSSQPSTDCNYTPHSSLPPSFPSHLSTALPPQYFWQSSSASTHSGQSPRPTTTSPPRGTRRWGLRHGRIPRSFSRRQRPGLTPRRA